MPCSASPDKFGVQLRYTEGGEDRPARRPQRQRLIAANKAAGEYYVDQLQTPDAQTGREFLTSAASTRTRPSSSASGSRLVGGDACSSTSARRASPTPSWSPAVSGDGPARSLRPVPRPPAVADPRHRRRVDRVRRPAVVRRRPDRGQVPQHPRDAALQEVATCSTASTSRAATSPGSQAVIVEGYTDVMACHLSGVPTAIATCGTAFGEDHARVLRRLLQDHDEFRGEVIFTFDGDAAGQPAAMKAFERDQTSPARPTSPSSRAASTPATFGCRRATPRSASWSPGGSRSTASCSPTWPPGSTSTAPTAGSTRCVRPPSWCRRSGTGRRSRRSPRAGRAGRRGDRRRPRRGTPGSGAWPAPTSGHGGRATCGRGSARPARPSFLARARWLKLVVQHPSSSSRWRVSSARRLHPPDVRRRLGAGDGGRWPGRRDRDLVGHPAQQPTTRGVRRSTR